jgi:hypothetical protein
MGSSGLRRNEVVAYTTMANGPANNLEQSSIPNFYPIKINSIPNNKFQITMTQILNMLGALEIRIWILFVFC